MNFNSLIHNNLSDGSMMKKEEEKEMKEIVVNTDSINEQDGNINMYDHDYKVTKHSYIDQEATFNDNPI